MTLARLALMWYVSSMTNLKNRLARPIRARRERPRPVALRITDNQGRPTIVTLHPGDTLDINHTIDETAHPHISLRVEARAARIELV